MKIDKRIGNEFGRLLLRWYAENGRELPWRNTNDPYRIWISEIILQQTRVIQGYNYFVRFVERFPNIKELAEASEDEVLKYWQGLGYYSRARNLHASARTIYALGQFPTTYEEVRKLRGVGDYTAAAICSFAFHQPYAVVDGNVYRVLSRFLGIDVAIDSTAGKRLFADLAAQMLTKSSPALYNQAIMDFGALQCTPRTPLCSDCPLATRCVARHTNRVTDLPVKEKNVKISHRYFYYFYIRAAGSTYLRKRNRKDIWQGLYEPPMLESRVELAESELLNQKEVTSLLAQDGVTLTILRNAIKHQLSHQLIYAKFYLIDIGDNSLTDDGWLSAYEKIPQDDLQLYAVPRLVSDLFELVTNHSFDKKIF